MHRSGAIAQFCYRLHRRRGGRDHTCREDSFAYAHDQAGGQDAAHMAVLRRTNKEHEMPGNPREMITMAERSFPVRIRIGVRPGGLGRRREQITPGSMRTAAPMAGR
jgi:hypothetical protein